MKPVRTSSKERRRPGHRPTFCGDVAPEHQSGLPGRAGALGWSCFRAGGPSTGVRLFVLLAMLLSGIAVSAQDSVCAKVKLSITQRAVIAGQGFTPTLTINNGAGADVQKVSVVLDIRDGSGRSATNVFSISAPTLAGVSAVDGTGVVPAGGSGRANWLLRPTRQAAPTDPTQYFVGGTLSYTQNGVPITIPLYANSIQVLPQPYLTVKYFQERVVYSDDPFTVQVEPAVPFNLGILVTNAGHGTAKGFTIASGQPQIVDNEKGLLISFQIVSGQAGTNALSPSLTLNLGDVAFGQTAFGRWLMTASLQGEFTNFAASYQAIDDLGNTNLSVVAGVEAHMLVHAVRVDQPGDDGLPDFLVNDVPNPAGLPESVHLSDGPILPVGSVTNATVTGMISPANLQVRVAANLPAGWSYMQIPDPGQGTYALAGVVRSDGKVLRLGDNAWTTHRTLHPPHQAAYTENLLRIFDYNSTGSYTVNYTPAPAPDTTPPTSAVAALPSTSRATFQVQWSGQDNPGGSSIAYYDVYVSTNGGLFGPWLQQTRQTSALFQGVLGGQYGFYSVATDQAGNREAAHAAADALTMVSLTNQPPVLAAIPDLFVNAGGTLQFTLSATDPDGTPDALTYQLGQDTPPGVTLDSRTGVLTWPTSTCAPASTNAFSVTVTDNGVPPMTGSGVVRVIVVKSNTPPVLAALGNVTINEGDSLTITNTATDSDCPPNAVTFSLGAGAPAGAVIDPAGGIFTWIPAPWQAPSTNRITVVATDNGVPPLSATQSFTVIVKRLRHDFGLSLGSTNLFAGETNSVPLVLDSRLSLTNLSFSLESTGGRLAQLSLQGASSEVTARIIQALPSGRWMVNLSLNAALNRKGPRSLGWLTFEATPDLHSAIVPLAISQPVGLNVQGQAYTNAAAANGLAIIVSSEPVLATDSPTSITVYGHPGSECGLQYRAALAPGASWTDWTRLVLTGRVVTVTSPFQAGRAAFYRAFELIAGAPLLSLSIQRVSGGLFGLTLQGEPGLQFSLQKATNLAPPIFWSELLNDTLTNPAQTYNWTNSTNREYFFRALPK